MIIDDYFIQPGWWMPGYEHGVEYMTIVFRFLQIEIEVNFSILYIFQFIRRDNI